MDDIGKNYEERQCLGCSDGPCNVIVDIFRKLLTLFLFFMMRWEHVVAITGYPEDKIPDAFKLR